MSFSELMNTNSWTNIKPNTVETKNIIKKSSGVFVLNDGQPNSLSIDILVNYAVIFFPGRINSTTNVLMPTGQQMTDYFNPSDGFSFSVLFKVEVVEPNIVKINNLNYFQDVLNQIKAKNPITWEWTPINILASGTSNLVTFTYNQSLLKWIII
jgi:hypothetical protein